MEYILEIKTERLLIRPVIANDAYEIYDYRSDVTTNKYQGWIPNSIDQVHYFVNNTASQINTFGTWFMFVIVDKETDHVIGDVGVCFLDVESLQAKIGYTLCKYYQGVGLATEAVSAVIDFLFKKLKKRRLICTIDPKNKKSIRLVQRLGFKLEENCTEKLLVDEDWPDDLIYTLVKREWVY